MMGAMLANVSTLLISVGWPHKPDCGRIGRARPRRAALAFDGRDQRGLFAAHERAGAQADVDAEIEVAAADAVAEQSLPLGRRGWPSSSRATASGYSART